MIVLVDKNVAESKYAQSVDDFISKMSIALKEASETYYWLGLLHDAGYLPEGASAKSLAYPLGVLNYLKKDYKQAAEYFLQCLPSNGEMEIAVIYWHSLACYMAGTEATLLDTFSENMEVGHHIAYKKTVTFFKNNDATDKDINDSSADLYSPATNDLDKAIILYGLSVFYKHINNNAKAKEFLDLALECSSVWPCVSYLAAYRDKSDSDN